MEKDTNFITKNRRTPRTNLGGVDMAETMTKVPIKQEKRTASSSAPQMWRPFESLRDEIDRLFDDFGRGFWRPFGRSLLAEEPLFRRELAFPTTPAAHPREAWKTTQNT